MHVPSTQPNISSAWRRAGRWTVLGLLGALAVASVLVASVSAGLLVLAYTHPRDRPLVLDRWIPQIERLAARRGVYVQLDSLSLFFERNLVVQAGGIRLYGGPAEAEREPGLVIDETVVRLANQPLFRLQMEPRALLVRGMTVQVLRHDGKMTLPGLERAVTGEVHPMGAISTTLVPDTVSETSGTSRVSSTVTARGEDFMLVDVLNGLDDTALANLRRLTLEDVTVLMRDEDAGAAWVLENGRARVSRAADTGEEAEVSATLRRLYGERGSLDNANTGGKGMPTVLRVAHQPQAEDAEISLRFDNADTLAVADYLPPKFADVLRGRGTVQLGTRLDASNRLASPWVRVGLRDVVVQPPEGYSDALRFAGVSATLVYQPSPTDVLTIRQLTAERENGVTLTGRGQISELTGDMRMNLSLSSARGSIGDITDLLPDQRLKKVVPWLRENIRAGEYRNLVVVYNGQPSALPHCGALCGLSFSADVQDGRVKFLPSMPEVSDVSGTVRMQGTELAIRSPRAVLGGQQAREVVVRLTNFFVPEPTHVLVNGQLRGGAGEVAEELQQLAKVQIDGRLQGEHSSTLALNIPLPKGRDPVLEEIGILVQSQIRHAVVDRIAGNTARVLPGAVTGVSGTVTIGSDRLVRIEAAGTYNASPAQLNLVDQLDKFGRGLRVQAHAAMPAAWLAAQLGLAENVSMTGVLPIRAKMQREQRATIDQWNFDAQGDAGLTAVNLPLLKWQKPAGESLLVAARGYYRQSMPAQSSGQQILLESLRLNGEKVRVAGRLQINPDTLLTSAVNLSPFVVGQNNLNVSLQNRLLSLQGQQLDISGFNLLGSSGSGGSASSVALDSQQRVALRPAPARPDDAQLDGLRIRMGLARVLAKQGTLTDVQGELQNRRGRWDIESLQAGVEGGGTVNVAFRPIGMGVRRLTIDVTNLGQTLRALGVYDRLRSGHLTGTLDYTGPDTAAGVLNLQDFELRNPPVLVQILSLVSLQQLLAGTDTILFDRARVPLRLEGDVVALDKAVIRGPSMSLRLTGQYDRTDERMDMDGQMAPGIPFNRLVAKIPLLGKLLTGSQDGLVVADFSLRGPADNPQVNVKPLSIITPGLLKDLFSNIRESFNRRNEDVFADNPMLSEAQLRELERIEPAAGDTPAGKTGTAPLPAKGPGLLERAWNCL